MEVTLYRYNNIRQGLLLKLVSSGQIGWGEIAPLPGWSLETLDQAEKELRQLSLQTNLTSCFPSVQFGVRSALLDLEKPITLPPIPISALAYLEHIKNRDLTPYTTIKIKVGHLPVHEAIAKMEAAKHKLQHCHLRIDANQAWTLNDALLFAKQCDWMKLDYFEEPLRQGEDLHAFPYPIALDESFRSGQNAHPMLKALIFKPTLQKWSSHLPEKGVDFILSSSYETEIGLMQIAKLAVRENIPLKPMGLDTYSKESLFEERLEMKDGKLLFPNTWTLKQGKANACFRMSL